MAYRLLAVGLLFGVVLGGNCKPKLARPWGAKRVSMLIPGKS